MINQKTLILIDGHALAYRMFFALERTRMKTSDGHSTWAVYGFLKTVFELLQKVKPDAIAVSFDCGRQTFRTEIYPEYKAHRQAMPDSLGEQLSLLFEGIETMGIPIYKMPGFEADDVIGTIAREAKELGHKSYILTGDQDSFQLVDNEGNIRVLIPTKGELIEYDSEKVHQKMGVYPEQIIDYKGLCGDTSDNIPGVKGIGEKTTVQLLEKFENIENLYEHLSEVKSASQKDKLEAGKEMAFKSKFLATINKEVPIEFDFEHTHLTMPDIQKFTDFLRKMEFFSILKQLPVLLKPFNNGEEPQIPQEYLFPRKVKQAEKPSGEGQLSLFAVEEDEEKVESQPPLESQEIQEQKGNDGSYSIIDTESKLEELITVLKTQKVISLDTETTDISFLTADLVGISFGWGEGLKYEDSRIQLDKEESETKAAYIPVGHKEGVQVDLRTVLDKLKPLLEDENLPKVFQNAKYEINIFKNYEIELKGIVFDTMIASYIKNPAFKHGLKQQALSCLKFPMKEIEELIGKGKSAITMAEVSIEYAAAYACDDAYATYELGKYYVKNSDKEQENVLYNIEVPLEEVLADMERVGVSIDDSYLKSLSAEIQTSLNSVEDRIYELAGEKFNVNSPKQVGEILFEKLQISSKGTAKTQTGYSTSAKVLESLAGEYEIAQLLLKQRHLAKIKSTYIDALPELISPKDERIHTSYNQTVTTTGRLSSSNPNLQNIPTRTETGNRIRGAFVPKDKENSVIFSADYSQIELRLLAHFSKDPVLMEAFNNNLDIHTATASKVFDVPLEDVTKDMRRKAKGVNFGIIYGQTSYGLSEAIGITPKEAKGFIEKYFETYPGIKEYMESVKVFAHKHGYVSTMYGRKRYLGDELSSRNKMIREFAERAAINAPLQGTAADLIKIAMIQLYKELQKSNYKAKMILQVHDELVLEMPKSEVNEVSKLVQKCMELEQPLDVPLVISMECGPSWVEGSEDLLAVY